VVLIRQALSKSEPEAPAADSIPPA